VSPLSRSANSVHIFSLFLSVLMPGLGQFYARQRKTAAAIYASGIVLYGLFWAGLYKHFYGLLLWLTALFVYCVVNIATAYTIGKKAGQNHVPYRCLAIYLLAAVVHLVLFLPKLFQLGLPVKTYHIPTSSMAPALQVGDYFMVEQGVDPGTLQRGDVVVFTSPTHPNIAYVKRIIGLPADVVEISGAKVWINSMRLSEPYLSKNPSSPSYYGRSHYGPLVVPQDGVYVLGDNRSHSADSRQFKSIELKSIIGKALYIVWSADLKRIGDENF
jgi:signal peptidase I